METLIQAGLSNALSATVLAILVFSLGRLLRDRPAVRHALWLLVLIKLVTPPLYSVPFSWSVLPSEPAPAVVVLRGMERSTAAETSVASARLGDESSFDLAQFDGLESHWEATATWLKPFVVDSPFTTMGRIWLMGTLLVMGLSVYRIAGFRRVVQAAEPVTDDVEDLVDELASRIGLAHSPSTRWIVGKFSPMVWALPGGRPKLLIPFELWKMLDHAQRSSLIAHELAHLRRGDHHVRLFEIVVTALYWWNPLVWLVRRGLRNAEEHCCDAWVVWTFPDFARSYAETLLETLDFLHPSDFAEPLLSSGFGRVDHLRKRLTMIMTGTSSRGLGASGLFGLAAVASLLLPIHPTWAGRAEDEEHVVVITVDDKEQNSKNDAKPTGSLTRADNLYTSLVGNGVDDQKDGSEPKAPENPPAAGTTGPAYFQIWSRKDLSGSHWSSDGKGVHWIIRIGDVVREIESTTINAAIKMLEPLKISGVVGLNDKQAAEVVDGIESAIRLLKQVKSTPADTTQFSAEAQAREKRIAEKREFRKVLVGKNGTTETQTFVLVDVGRPLGETQNAKAVKPLSDKHAVAVNQGIQNAIESLKQAQTLGAKTKKLMAEKQEAENKAVELTARSDLGTFYVVRNFGPGPASPEDTAKVAKAAERVEAIAREVESKQLELQKATRELEALSPPVFTKVKVSGQDHSGSVKSSPVVVSDNMAKAMEARVYKHNVRETSSMKLEAKTPSNSAPDQQRIAELEAKLQKLIDEVKSLKNASPSDKGSQKTPFKTDGGVGP